MKLTDEQLAVFVAKYDEEPKEATYFGVFSERYFAVDWSQWHRRMEGFTLGLSHQQAEVERLRQALTKELSVWEFYKEYAVKHHSQTHVCLRIETITAALAPDNATPVKEQS